MNENLTSNNTQNNESTLDPKESEYQNLIIRLQEIRATIALLENKISK